MRSQTSMSRLNSRPHLPVPKQPSKTYSTESKNISSLKQEIKELTEEIKEPGLRVILKLKFVPLFVPESRNAPPDSRKGV